jgi:hypothetical protein
MRYGVTKDENAEIIPRTNKSLGRYPSPRYLASRYIKGMTAEIIMIAANSTMNILKKVNII